MPEGGMAPVAANFNENVLWTQMILLLLSYTFGAVILEWVVAQQETDLYSHIYIAIFRCVIYTILMEAAKPKGSFWE